MPYKNPEKRKAYDKEYAKKRRKTAHYQSYMKSYMKEYSKNYEKTPQKRFANTKWQSKKRSLEFSITLEEFTAEISKPCVYCNNLLGKKSICASGLDRKDNAIGYTAGNICSCCWICNSIKGEHLTFDEMKEVVKLIINMRNLNE